MPKITATRRVQFAVGHRVCRHESKCRHLHGHNYVFFLTAEAEKLDDVGRVIDFGALKERIGSWIERYWDHGFVLYAKDEAGNRAMQVFTDAEKLQQKLFLLPENPTAENMAKYLLTEVGPLMLEGSGVVLTKVTVWETENCIAEASL